ncbi:MAG TPA: DUF481 domain-containing protein [Vicinamibacterales bacterium]
MHIRSVTTSLTVLVLITFAPLASFAQAPAQPAAPAQPTPPPPPPGWAGSASAGLALTQGNSDTSTVNAAYELLRDTGGRLIVKSNGLLVYGKSEEILTSDRLALAGRLEGKLNERSAVFGQVQYLRDSFKSIDYLVAPTVGLSRVLFKDAVTELGIDGSVGVVWEQNPGFDLDMDGAVSAGQQLTRKLSATTELKQKAGALWVMDDFGDALYTLIVGVATNITSGTQMKFEFLDTFKNKPKRPEVQKNDIAILLSFVYKFD